MANPGDVHARSSRTSHLSRRRDARDSRATRERLPQNRGGALRARTRPVAKSREGVRSRRRKTRVGPRRAGILRGSSTTKRVAGEVATRRTRGFGVARVDATRTIATVRRRVSVGRGDRVGRHARDARGRGVLERRARGSCDAVARVAPAIRFPLLVALHAGLYGVLVRAWSDTRVNAPFIFGAKRGTELTATGAVLAGSLAACAWCVVAMVLVASGGDSSRGAGDESRVFVSALVSAAVGAVVFLAPWPRVALRRVFGHDVERRLERGLARPRLHPPDSTRRFFLGALRRRVARAVSSRDHDRFLPDGSDCLADGGASRRRHRRASRRRPRPWRGTPRSSRSFPGWLRLVQCLRRRRDDGQRVHLINAGKYLAGLVATSCGLIVWYEETAGRVRDDGVIGGHVVRDPSAWRLLYNAATYVLAAAAYGVFWDFFMDWSVFSVVERRSTDRAPKSRDRSFFRSLRDYRVVAFRRRLMIRERWKYHVAIAFNLATPAERVDPRVGSPRGRARGRRRRRDLDHRLRRRRGVPPVLLELFPRRERTHHQLRKVPRDGGDSAPVSRRRAHGRRRRRKRRRARRRSRRKRREQKRRVPRRFVLTQSIVLGIFVDVELGRRRSGSASDADGSRPRGDAPRRGNRRSWRPISSSDRSRPATTTRATTNTRDRRFDDEHSDTDAEAGDVEMGAASGAGATTGTGPGRRGDLAAVVHRGGHPAHATRIRVVGDWRRGRGRGGVDAAEKRRVGGDREARGGTGGGGRPTSTRSGREAPGEKYESEKRRVGGGSRPSVVYSYATHHQSRRASPRPRRLRRPPRPRRLRRLPTPSSSSSRIDPLVLVAPSPPRPSPQKLFLLASSARGAYSIARRRLLCHFRRRDVTTRKRDARRCRV